MENRSITSEMEQCFSAWGANTLPSKYDQLIWVEAGNRFALLGRDYIDLKLDKSWYTRTLWPVHIVSEIALAATKKVSGIFYRPECAADVYNKIREKADEFREGITELNESQPECTKKRIITFYQGLEMIHEGCKELCIENTPEYLEKCKERDAIFASMFALKLLGMKINIKFPQKDEKVESLQLEPSESSEETEAMKTFRKLTSSLSALSLSNNDPQISYSSDTETSEENI